MSAAFAPQVPGEGLRRVLFDGPDAVGHAGGQRGAVRHAARPHRAVVLRVGAFDMLRRGSGVCPIGLLVCAPSSFLLLHTSDFRQAAGEGLPTGDSRSTRSLTIP